jgi:hypothetical protein
VHSVVGHVPGDHEANGWHVQDGSVVGVGVPGLNRAWIRLPSSSNPSVGIGWASTGDSGMRPGKIWFHSCSRPCVACWCMTRIVPSVA